jgi:hypothetical protein
MSGATTRSRFLVRDGPALGPDLRHFAALSARQTFTHMAPFCVEGTVRRRGVCAGACRRQGRSSGGAPHGKALTPERKEFGYELRFSRFKTIQTKP